MSDLMTMASIGFELIDGLAFILFLGAWMLHYWIVHLSPMAAKTITHAMLPYRERWLINMVRREMKMPDVLIQNGLQQGVMFFASTTILIIGVLLAGLGAADTAVMVLNDLPLSSTSTRAEWDLKVLLVLLIFIFAFFKFAWTYRLFNYVTIMIGAAPLSVEDTPRAYDYARTVCRLHAAGAKHFTIGLNSFFFALAAVAWFLNAWVFMAATIWVSLVMYRRAFRSRCQKTLRSGADSLL